MSAAAARFEPLTRAGERVTRELVVCSLEAWDEVWRRNQFFVDALLRRDPALRVLFVEPPTDVLFELAQRRRPPLPRLARLREDGRLVALRPLKPLPRRLGSFSDRALLRSVPRAARRLGLRNPTLWINDVTYAPLIESTGWPTLYDVTDDWLLAPASPREIDRLRGLDALALRLSQEVVVCSPALASSRGARREVTLVPNGVDAEHFRRPRPRPEDLPDARFAVYVGTLNEARLDVELVVELARALPDLSVVLVGPDALARESRRTLAAQPNVRLVGSRPYEAIPGYLQHADVVIVPHLVSPFTDSLDPIKAYECLAVGRPTVATAVAGFRELADRLTVVPRAAFIDAVKAALESKAPVTVPSSPGVGWNDRAAAFEAILARAGVEAREHGGS